MDNYTLLKSLKKELSMMKGTYKNIDVYNDEYRGLLSNQIKKLEYKIRLLENSQWS